MRIFLIGFMGSGKSYTGKRLAAALHLPFTDLDALIEKQQGRSVQEIFRDEGELAFRQMEQTALRETATFAEAIIACGGGTPCFADNMEWMNAQGITVYLQTPVEVLAQRLLPEMAQRPLLHGLDETSLPAFIAEKLAFRESWYLQAQVTARVPEALEEMLLELKKQMER